MANLRRRQGSGIAAALIILAIQFLGGPARSASFLYERPVLIVDPGTHTAMINSVAVDAGGRFAVTGSSDKTVRVWSLDNGRLLQTIRVPAGAGAVGRVDAVALSPDGTVIAAGGWTGGARDHPIYLFERMTGKMIGRIVGPTNISLGLAFSHDGRYIAATLGGSEGVRVYDRDSGWTEVFRDADYEDRAFSPVFSADGRLATASYDGKVRLYQNFKLTVPPKDMTTGEKLRSVAFTPNGALLAAGFTDSATVEILDGHSLKTLVAPDVAGLKDAGLGNVAWSVDGQALVAAGRYAEGDKKSVVVWSGAGRGERWTFPASPATILDVASLPDGGIFVVTAGPDLAVFEFDGRLRWRHEIPIARFLNQKRLFSVSANGASVDFGFEQFGKAPFRFDVQALTLTANPNSRDLAPPIQTGLEIEDWDNSYGPTIDGKPISLKFRELSRSLAIHPDRKRFVIGTNWRIRAFDDDGDSIWQRQAPGEVWAVNITADGRIVVAAYGDGTIRWHRMDNGRELMAFMVLSDRRSFVAWTPEGYYAATAGAHSVLRWHINRGPEASGEAIAVSEFAALHRPKVLSFVLQELETIRAIGLALDVEVRDAIRVRTGASVAPGAQLHVLAIGVSNYGDKSNHLRLNFAHKDARDVTQLLMDRQKGLYTRVNPAYLDNENAHKAAIFETFASIERNMAKATPGQDVAVVMFSGHGAVIDRHFYLLPYGVDARTPAQIKASGLPAAQFKDEIDKLAQHGRVLVLLDACRSGAVTADGSRLETNADMLRSVMASGNITVLTSSKADKPSLEHERWQNGAFTKVLLEALRGAADEDRNGLISTGELTRYIVRHLPALSVDQDPGIELRFENDIFVGGL